LLHLAWRSEPIGQRYLRRILAVFKFELNGVVASIVALPGLAWLGIAGVVSWRTVTELIVSDVVVTAFLFQAATESSRLLATIRQSLLDEITERPSPKRSA